MAVLLDHYHLTLDRYARLTDWQIQALYFHARNEDGQLEPPVQVKEDWGDRYRPPASLEEELRMLDLVNAAVPGGKGLKNYAEARQTILERWATGVRVSPERK